MNKEHTEFFYYSNFTATSTAITIKTGNTRREEITHNNLETRIKRDYKGHGNKC